jgi:hypothetical protein
MNLLPLALLQASIMMASVLVALSATSAASGSNNGTLRVGEPLPRLEGSFLTGRDAMLPEAARGQVAFLALGFTYKSRYAVEPWTAWFRKEFGKTPGVTFFEIPVVGGMAKMGRWFIDRGMRSGTPPELHEHVITVYRGAGDWKKRVGHAEAGDDHAYLVVLDRDGIVRWTARGPFDPEKTEEVRSVVAALIAADASQTGDVPAAP